MKKFLLISVLLLLSSYRAMAFYVDNINYAITSDTTVEVTSPQDSVPSNLVIPEQITYEGKVYNVTSIGDSAFMWCNPTFIELPYSVTKIGDAAFSHCDAFAISVDSGNKTYDSRNNCNAIIETATNTLIVGTHNTIIPNSVTGIGNYAFCGCDSLETVKIPNSVTTIETRAFSDCWRLTSVIIGNSVGWIGDWAFYSCYSLETIEIPNSVMAIGSDAFNNCKNLTSVIIGNGIRMIGTRGFQYCDKLTSVYCRAETPPIILFGSTLSDRIIDSLLVPIGCVDVYEQSPWADSFRYIVDDGRANVIDVDTTSATLCWAPQPDVMQYVINVYENENPYAEFVVNADGTVVSEKYADNISPAQSTQSYCIRKENVGSENGTELSLMKIVTDTTVNSTEYFVITLNNLQPGTEYSYTVQGMNAKGECIYEETVTFTTLTSTDLELVFTPEEKKYKATKFYYKSAIYIRHSNGDVYNMRGIKVN